MRWRRAKLPAAAPIVHGRQLSRGFDEDCDVVVVGSGAGGATAATLLAEAGLQIIVLEEGPYYRPEDYRRFKPTESLRRLFRESGMVAAVPVGQTPVISVTAGRAVGGSSILTGGVCFRIPSSVHQRWVRELGLGELAEDRLAAAYDDVERRLRVIEVPEQLRSRSTRVFVEGAAKLGVEMRSLRRNMSSGCEGLGRCTFGCPVLAKRSVDLSYLPEAIRHGATIVSDALVERVLVRRGRAAGVEGRLLGGRYGAPSARFRVRALAVVAACGSLHTPLLLRSSGVRSPLLGRDITLHPGLRMVGRFAERLNGWDGAMQSVYSDHYEREGITLVGVFTTPNVLAASLTGIGPELMRRVRQLSHVGVFGGMIHDDGGGRLLPGPGREPVLSYRMAAQDFRRLRRAITVMAEMALAGGAVEVFPPVFGVPPIRTPAQARALENEPIDARRIECVAFHPLGSARMGSEAPRGVVDQEGQCYELPGLFVADGSVLPTSIGVNSQVPVMALATHVAWRLRERLVGRS